MISIEQSRNRLFGRPSAGAAIFILVVLATWVQGLGANSPHRLPPGFALEIVAGNPHVRFPMFACFDDDGRLYVAESSGLDLYEALQKQTRLCRISCLEDRDHDGQYETASVYATNLVFPMGLAWRDRRLYVADPPELVAFEDLDGDGRADRRVPILGQFGHKDNGSLHGLMFGPDDLLYMTMGSPDGYRLPKADGTFLEGRNGALIRCRPDGSNPEVLARGFENLVEIEFLPTGEIVGTDNWFTLPAGGIRDALVHLETEGQYPLNQHEPDASLPLTGALLPAITRMPAVALSGLALYRSESFPPEMRGHLFSAQHNTRKIVRHRLVENGSTFRTEDFDFLTSDDPDFHPSDVLEAADGSLIVIDTGGWYVQHCPTGKIRNSQSPGGIYRLRYTLATSPPDPWGKQIPWANLNERELAGLLADKRPFVRARAQRLLASKGSTAAETLNRLLETSDNFLAKSHAVWTLVALPREVSAPILTRALRAEDPRVSALAARALSLVGATAAARHLESLLVSSASPRARLAAAQALAVCGNADSVSAVLTSLARGGDAFEQHGLAHALYRTATKAQLLQALHEPNATVRKIALLLLDRPPHSALTADAVIQNLSSNDRELRATALRLLQRHTEWAPAAAIVLRDLLSAASLSDQMKEIARGIVTAFQAQESVQGVVGSRLEHASSLDRADHRLLLLQAIGQCSLSTLPKSWHAALAAALKDPSAAVRQQAFESVIALRPAGFEAALLALACDAGQPADLRVRALAAVAPTLGRLDADLFEFLLEEFERAEAPARRLTAGYLLGRSRLSNEQQQKLIAAAGRQTLVSPSTLLPAFRQRHAQRTHELLLEYLHRSMESGWRPHLEELNSVLQTLPDELRSQRELLLSRIQEDVAAQRQRLMELESLLQGGDENRGSSVFHSEKAQCAVCHRVGNEGGSIGPDLTKIGAIRSGRDLIESIAFPNSTFAQGYEPYSLELANGEQLDGMIARHNGGGVLFRDPAGGERWIPSAEMKEMRRRSTSVMPEGLDAVLTREEMRDLLAFLQSLK